MANGLIVPGNVISYFDAFTQFNSESQKIYEDTYTLADIALYTSWDFRRKGAIAKIAQLHEPKIIFRTLVAEDKSKHALLDVEGIEPYVHIGHYQRFLVHEPEPTKAEQLAWESLYRNT